MIQAKIMYKQKIRISLIEDFETNKHEKRTILIKQKNYTLPHNVIALYKGENIYWGSLKSPNYEIISGSNDQTVKKFDLKSGSCTNTFKGHEGFVKCLIVSFTGELITGSCDKKIKVKHLCEFESLKSIKHNNF